MMSSCADMLRGDIPAHKPLADILNANECAQDNPELGESLQLSFVDRPLVQDLVRGETGQEECEPGARRMLYHIGRCIQAVTYQIILQKRANMGDELVLSEFEK